MPAFNFENLQMLFLKLVLILFFGLILVMSVKVLHRTNFMKKLEVYKETILSDDDKIVV